MNDLYAEEWSQFTNHFKPTFKLRRREKKDGKTKKGRGRRRWGTKEEAYGLEDKKE